MSGIEGEPHDYEQGEYTSPMQSDPMCRVCGLRKHHSLHEPERVAAWERIKTYEALREKRG